MSDFLEQAKAAGYSESEAKDFQTKVEKARKAGYSNDEIFSFLKDKNAMPDAPKGQTTIGPRSPAMPLEGSIRPASSPADDTADMLRRGNISDTGKAMIDAAPEVIGATGAMMLAPPVGIPAAMATAAAGGAGGKGLQIIGQQLSGDQNAPTGMDAVKEMAGAGTRQGAAEGFGRLLIKSIQRVARGGFFDVAENVAGKTGNDKLANKEALFKGKGELPPEKQEAILKSPKSTPKQVMEAFGGNYTLAQMTKSRVLDFLDNMAQGSFLGGDVMGKAFDAQEKTVKAIGDKVSDMFVGETGAKLSDRQLGQLFADTVQGGRKAFKTAAEKMFRNVDDTIYAGMQLAAPGGNSLRKTVEGYSTPEIKSLISSMSPERFKEIYPGDRILKFPNGVYFIPNKVAADMATDASLVDDWHEFMDMGRQRKTDIHGIKGVMFDFRPEHIQSEIETNSVGNAAPGGGLGPITRFEGLTGPQDAREIVPPKFNIPADRSQPIKQKQPPPFEQIPQKKPSESGYVSLRPAIDKAQEVIADYSRVRNIGKSDAGGTLFDKIAALPETLTFGDAQLLRSTLLDEVRNMESTGGNELRHAKEFAGLVDQQMEKAAKNLSGDALEAWRDANKFYKFGMNNFDNDFIHKLTRSGKVNWEEVGDNIFRSGNVDEVYKARNALRSAEFASKKAAVDLAPGETPPAPIDFQSSWRQMQSGYYESLIQKNTGVDGVLNPNGLLKDLQNRKTSRTIQAAFNNDQLNAVRNFAKAAQASTQKNAQGGGKLLIQLTQGGALLGLTGLRASNDELTPGQFAMDAGKIILGPAVLAKLMTNPITTRWLIQGLKTPASSGAATALATRIGVAAARAMQNQPMISETKDETVPASK